MDEKIRKILEAAIQAPSGDNCQPWHLVVQGNQIDLFNIPDRDQSLYNYKQRASFVAHGALLENLSIAAVMEGFGLEIEFFPDEKKSNLVAMIKLKEGGVKYDPLFESINDRCTNRYPFSKEVLKQEILDSLKDCINNFEGVRVFFTESQLEKDRVSALVAKNDWLVFENRQLHDFLFGHVRWNKQEVEQSRDGLDIDTLGLSKFDRIAFPIFKNWSIVNLLNKFSFAHLIGLKADLLCSKSAHLGAIIISDNNPVDYILGGRVLQRLWLQAAKQKIQFQPIAGIAFLMQMQREGHVDTLSKRSQMFLSKMSNSLNTLFSGFSSGDGRVVLAFFRLGMAERPNVKTLRRGWESVTTVKE